jgi:hypothetical protein
LPVILPICLADIGTANICGVSVATVKQIWRESSERSYTQLTPYIFDKVHIFPPQRPSALPRSNIFPWVADSTITTTNSGL